MFKKRALALTAVLALGLIPTLPSYAVTTYASPADLIEDVVEVALTGVASPTKGDALTEMKGKITLTGDEVFYDGTSIGYWYTEDSSTIYTTEAKAGTVVASDGSNGWEVEPLIFEDILSDVNDDLIENVVPTTTDWNDIIGKYDITLGGEHVIPADQWVDTESSSNPLSDGTTITIPSSGITTGNYVCILTYVIDDSGELYIKDALIEVITANGRWYVYWGDMDTTWDKHDLTFHDGATYDSCYTGPYEYLKVGTTCTTPGIATSVYLTNLTNSTYGLATSEFSNTLYKLTDPTVTMTESVSPAARTGIAYFYSSLEPEKLQDEFKSMFAVAPSSSKKVVGNTTLTKRLAKLSNLAASDTIVFTSTGWTVNGLDDLDSYISTSILTEAGQSASMDGAVEIEELNFKVVVPSTLPMIADSEGNVQVASNASIDNKSNAKVKITGLEIEANSESGWTMVDSNPSKTRGDNEFSFGTSLSIGDVIAKGDALEFTYNADLSPAEQGVDSVDLVTLTITLDWAE